MSAKILAVDDEPNMLRLLKTILTSKTEHEVVTTNNPLEAVELLKSQAFDVLITDLKMPVLDGMDLIDQVKQIDPYLPIIMVTAYGTIETAEEAVRRGAYDYITKPFRQEAILITLKRALEWRQMHLELERLKKPPAA